MDLEHGRVALVRVEAGHAHLAAAEQGTEELVQMGEEEAVGEEETCELSLSLDWMFIWK